MHGGWKVHEGVHLLFFTHTLCDYVMHAIRNRSVSIGQLHGHT